VGYQAALEDRFRNPHIKHRTYQIAMDGSQKLPQRILGTVCDSKANTSTLALAAAGWMRYVRSVDEKGAAFQVQDPLCEVLKQKSNESNEPAEVAATLFGIESIFGSVSDNSAFKEQVVAHLENIMTKGMLETIKAHVAK